jgi:hypothetical protein
LRKDRLKLQVQALRLQRSSREQEWIYLRGFLNSLDEPERAAMLRKDQNRQALLQVRALFNPGDADQAIAGLNNFLDKGGDPQDDTQKFLLEAMRLKLQNSGEYHPLDRFLQFLFALDDAAIQHHLLGGPDGVNVTFLKVFFLHRYHQDHAESIDIFDPKFRLRTLRMEHLIEGMQGVDSDAPGDNPRHLSFVDCCQQLEQAFVDKCLYTREVKNQV